MRACRRIPNGTGRQYDGCVKLTLAVELDEQMVDAVDAAALDGESRSETIGRLLRDNVVARHGNEVDDPDRKLIDEHADELNEQALDVLGFQVGAGRAE